MNKNKRKLIIGIISVILGTAGIISIINIKNSGNVMIEENTGIVIKNNTGIVKSYTMGGGTTHTKNKKSTQNEEFLYDPTYIKNENAIIQNNGEDLEGIFVENYTYSLDDVSFVTAFGEDQIEIIFGTDHPNGFKILARSDEYAYNLNESLVDNLGVVIEGHGDIKEGSNIQISPYDFDADGISELIVCITDEIGTGGICSVFSFTHVDERFMKVSS